jgi:hypothetical protein
MDEIAALREAFGPDDVPSQAAQNRARAALHQRMAANEQTLTTKGRHRHRRTRYATTAGVVVATAAAVIAAVAVTRSGGGDRVPSPKAGGYAGPTSTSAVLPFARPANAAEYLENAAWTAERKPWTDPRPDQFMYIETLELRNKPAYENEHPNDPIQPGLGENRKIQEWFSVDGQTQARYQNGTLVVTKRGENGEFFDRIAWSTITSMNTPDKVPDGVPGPGSMGVDLDAFIGQYVLPPNVQAAIFRHLAQEPGMTVNPDAVNIDGRPAIGLGRIIEGYLSQELLFDKQTYAFIGERLVSIKDHVTHGDDGDAVSHKGDVYRQVVYKKMIIVDHAGDIG